MKTSKFKIYFLKKWSYIAVLFLKGFEGGIFQRDILILI